MRAHIKPALAFYQDRITALGGYLNQDGVVQLDALIVDGTKHDFGAVGSVTQVKNPVTLARKIMEETGHCFFIGDGANRMAQKLGIPTI